MAASDELRWLCCIVMLGCASESKAPPNGRPPRQPAALHTQAGPEQSTRPQPHAAPSMSSDAGVAVARDSAAGPLKPGQDTDEHQEVQQARERACPGIDASSRTAPGRSCTMAGCLPDFTFQIVSSANFP
jgi:septal ring-binding cell division protein DamX